MIINRHNYETFFLLYVDNELAVEDRAEVEKFVQENPDLAAEMEMLTQAILPNENISFEHKEVLYNHTDGITLDNYEEQFLLSVDEELSEQENAEVEKFVLKHPQLQDEYTLLKQTRLEPEAIVFAGKEKLYKKEGKERRLVYVNWMRISAAAVVIGLIAMGWFFSQNQQQLVTTAPVSPTDKTVETLPATKPPVKTADYEKTVAALDDKLAPKTEKVKSTKTEVVNKVRSKSVEDVFAVNTIKNKPQQSGVQPARVIDAPREQVERNKPFENSTVSSSVPANSNSTAGNDKATVAVVHETRPGASLVTQAVYREIDNEENEEENTLYIGSAEINKNKLRGLFKKAASLFERKNNDGDEQRTLKIAGFEIKTK